MPAHPLQDPYVLDVEDLDSIAQALLISRISSQPLAPGQQRESADFPIPGMVKPGIKLTVLTEYITDVPIARHPSAEVRLSMTVPNQSHPIVFPVEHIQDVRAIVRRRGLDVSPRLGCAPNQLPS